MKRTGTILMPISLFLAACTPAAVVQRAELPMTRQDVRSCVLSELQSLGYTVMESSENLIVGRGRLDQMAGEQRLRVTLQDVENSTRVRISPESRVTGESGEATLRHVDEQTNRDARALLDKLRRCE